jgi:hypothetical protein
LEAHLNEAGHFAQPAAESNQELHRGPMDPQEHKVEQRLAAIFAADARAPLKIKPSSNGGR